MAQFFATYYTPDNAVLSIAGDFEPGEARRLVEKHFGEIPRGSGRPGLPDMRLAPRFGEWRHEVVPDDIMLPRLFLAFRSPVFGSDAYYPASTCGAVLGLRNASLLRRRLVRERQVAADVTAFTYDLSKGADLLVIDATARPGVSADVLEQAVASEIDAIIRDGVTDEDVERATAVIQTMFVTSLQQAAERADRISLFATYLGDPTRINDEVDRYRAVTAGDVNRFIRESMGDDNRASLVYVPREASAEDLVTSGAAAANE